MHHIARVDGVVVAWAGSTAEHIAAVASCPLLSSEAIAAALPHEEVPASTTDQEVHAATTVDAIQSALSENGIVAPTTEDDVGPLPGEDHVVSTVPAYDVRLWCSSEFLVVPRCADDCALRPPVTYTSREGVTVQAR